jgi:hypothetical protein
MAARAQLRIEVSDPGLTQSLTGFMEHTIYSPQRSDEGVVVVTGPEGLPHEIARAEITLYLKAWHRLHPQASASLID